MRFAVLGPLRAWREAAEIDLGPPQQRLLLAVLLVREGRPVGVDTLVDLLWENDPPASAVNVVHRYVGALRRLFEPGLPPRAQGSWLIRQAGSYRLAVTAESCDVAEYRDLTAKARELAGADAFQAYAAALQLWHGPAAYGLTAPSRTKSLFLDLDHDGCRTVCAAADLALEIGCGADIVADLRQMARLDEYNEAIQTRLVRALAAAGNQTAALKAYESFRRKLADDLGVAPGPELTGAQRAVLSAPQPEARLSVKPGIRPAQLPSDLRSFAGRRTELDELDGLRSRGVVAIDGMPGSGKTTLAAHWAHSIADEFPDGQLYVNMRGFDVRHAQLTPAEALRGFLGGLGIPPNQIPGSIEAQSALYRTALADRRVLVLIDNARHADDVRPLLPAARGCLAVVTSRNRLAGFDAITLHPLTMAEAKQTLAMRLGQDRVDSQAEAVEEIIALCGRLPLALAIVAARAVDYPHFPLSAVLTRIKQAKGTLHGLSGDDLDMHTAFSWSYRILSQDAARLFRLLSVHSGPTTSVEAAASIAGLPVSQALALLNELARTSFLTEQEPGRFGAHDLIRTYAGELCDEADSDDERREALGRLLDYYLHTSYQAYLLMGMPNVIAAPAPARAGAAVVHIADQTAAQNWFRAEQRAIEQLARTAAEHDFLPYTWYLALTLQNHYHRQGRAHDWLTTMTTGLNAARRAGDKQAQARTHRAVAGAYYQLERYEQSLDHLKQTEHLLIELGDTAALAYVYSNYARVATEIKRSDEAVEYHCKALALFRQNGDREGEGTTAGLLALALAEIGEFDEAIPLGRLAIDIQEGNADRHALGGSWDMLGCVYSFMREHEQAAQCLRRAVEIYQETDAPNHVADASWRLADALRALGKTDEALSAWQTVSDLIDERDMFITDEARARLTDLIAAATADLGRLSG
ncbi:tetratricopeptide repeat protein [Kibdelosporangium philippinense]|uniref:Tetratricopeptide repeat protein n=1 Tax=Kibdelosporangium philippinense TaxID=211113 RepID=A0ABS8ZJQ5_9PSEU|nr:BTAD domain-containing putative transcriptional regulator [Kibdelosporangium philippinense]MCE7006866.1 tetratricopeptide repeat protein [Kibdelosporangium philippinense]